MIPKTNGIIGVFLLLLLAVNCSDDNSVCPEFVPGPKVMAIYPQQGAVDVPTDTFLSVTFDKVMDPASISAGSFFLQGPRGLVNAIVSFDSNSTATLTPLERLAGHSVFTAHIDAGVRDIEGRRMNVLYAWSFTTGTTQQILYPDIEYTIRDADGDGNPDELVGGGPPGRFLQAGVNGLQVDRAVIEFPLDQIVHDEVLQAHAVIKISATTVPNGIANFELWGFIGDGQGNISDWSNGYLTGTYNNIEVDSGLTILFPIADIINATLDSSATHVGLRFVVTGEPVIGIATSSGSTDDDRPRILVLY